jgi:hypothetical protein
MPKLATISFTGKSGRKYEFTVYSRDTEFKDLGAVYFMTKRVVDKDGKATHDEIYVGQTDSLKRRPLNHERKPCFDKHKADCVCVYLEEEKKTRLAIETDLRERYDPPCNRQ